MEPKLYNAYISALLDPSSSAGTEGLKQVIREGKDKSEEITLCVKFYDMQGLSNEIHHA